MRRMGFFRGGLGLAMGKVRRVRRSAGGWAVVVERWRASGLSGDAFCRRDGVDRAGFYRWRALLAAAQGPAMSACLVSTPGRSVPIPERPAMPSFLASASTARTALISSFAPATPAVSAARTLSAPVSTNAFLDLGLLGQGTVAAGRFELRLDLGAGVVLTLARG